MGYTITIGNAVPDFSKEYGELSARWVVEAKALDEAPVFPNDEMTANTNERSPSYSAWTEFCREVGIYDLFFDKSEGLMREHPGCQIITRKHLAVVQAALNQRQEKATKPPGFVGDRWDGVKFEHFDVDRYDHQIARLLWLEFWMRWALGNCETPAIENT